MRREKELAQLLAVISLIAFGISASGMACPKSPGFRLTDEAREKCEDKVGGSLVKCRQYVDSLLDVEDLTDQQRFDLADLLAFFNTSANGQQSEESLRLRSLQEYHILHEEYPDDVQVMWGLALLEDRETSLQLHRRIAHLAPDCNLNNLSLVNELDHKTGWGRDRADQDEDLVQEFVSLLDQGYEHAESVWDKMDFGHRRYREYLLAGEQNLARIFWNRVVAELDPESFPQDNTYAYGNGWFLLCGHKGFEFRFAEICLDTIEKTFKEALESDTSYVNGYRGVSLLAQQLLNPWSNSKIVLDPSPPNVHEVTFRPYRASEGGRILMRLRDLMESVPEDARNSWFEETYKILQGQMPRPAEPEEGSVFNLLRSPSNPDISRFERL